MSIKNSELKMMTHITEVIKGVSVTAPSTRVYRLCVLPPDKSMESPKAMIEVEMYPIVAVRSRIIEEWSKKDYDSPREVSEARMEDEGWRLWHRRVVNDFICVGEGTQLEGTTDGNESDKCEYGLLMCPWPFDEDKDKLAALKWLKRLAIHKAWKGELQFEVFFTTSFTGGA